MTVVRQANSLKLLIITMINIMIAIIIIIMPGGPLACATRTGPALRLGWARRGSRGGYKAKEVAVV